MDEEWFKSFEEKLDKVHAWPTLFTFKFIVKAGKEEELRSLFPLHQDTSRPSKNGNYTSITYQMMVPNSKAVIDVYRKAAVIEGIVAL